MSAEQSIRDVWDEIGAIAEIMSTSLGSRTPFHTIIDRAGDRTYELDVNGWPIANLDDALDAGSVIFQAGILSPIFSRHDAYLQRQVSSSNIEAYLATVGWRVSQRAADAWYTARSRRIPPQWVFPKGIIAAGDPSSLGLHCLATWSGTQTWEVGADGAIPTTLMGAPIIARTLSADPQGTSPVVTVTLQDNTTKDLAALVFGTSQWEDIVLGAQAVNGTTSAGDVDVPVAVTAPFKAGEYVWIEDSVDPDICELARISTLTTNTKLTMTTALLKDHTATAYVMPMYRNVVRKSGSILAGTSVGFYGRPDRAISLTP